MSQGHGPHGGADEGALARADALLDLGRPEDARREAAGYLAGHPDSAPAHIVLAQALHELDRHDEAADLATRAIALDPTGLHGYVLLASARISLGDQRQAVETGYRLRDLAPDHWLSHFTLARALLTGRKPRTRDALDAALVAVQLAPHEAIVHNLVGVCLNALGDREQARRAFNEALRLDPSHHLAQGNLADLDLAGGDLTSASDRIRSALSLAPGDEGLHESLDWLILRLVRRLFLALAAAGVVVGIEVATGAAYWVRALTGVALLAVFWIALRRTAGLLPRGVSLIGRDLFVRVRWSARYLLALTLVALVAVVFMAFAPHPIAAAAGLALLFVVRIGGLVVIAGLIVRAAVGLVRR